MAPLGSLLLGATIGVLLVVGGECSSEPESTGSSPFKKVLKLCLGTLHARWTHLTFRPISYITSNYSVTNGRNFLHFYTFMSASCQNPQRDSVFEEFLQIPINEMVNSLHVAARDVTLLKNVSRPYPTSITAPDQKERFREPLACIVRSFIRNITGPIVTIFFPEWLMCDQLTFNFILKIILTTLLTSKILSFSRRQMTVFVKHE